MKKPTTRRQTVHYYRLFGIGLVCIIALVVIYSLWHLDHKNNASPAVAAKSTAATTAAPNVTPTNSTPDANPNVPGATPSTTAAGSPEAPSGSFVSSYNASTSTELQSDCNTTAGATCTISFSNNGVTKSLQPTIATSSPKEAQVASASWSWQPSDIGLTPGSWTVSATATLNGQTATTKSSVTLVITND